MFATWRRRGLTGVRELVWDNLWNTQDCYRLEISLVNRNSKREPGAPQCLSICRGELEELRRWRAVWDCNTLPADFFEDETHGLEWFYLARWSGEVAHILWVANAGKPGTVSDVRLQPGAVEIRNVHTLSAFRRRHIFADSLAFVLADLQLCGIKTVCTHVNFGNTASLKGFLAVGFRLAEQIQIRRVLGMDWIKRKTLQGSGG
jgi:hypothetical protein